MTGTTRPHSPAPRLDPRRASNQGVARPRAWLLGAYRWLDDHPFYRWILLGTVALYIGLLVAPDLRLRGYPDDPHLLGLPATENIKAPYDIELIDEDTTARLRREAQVDVRDVFDFDAEQGQRTSVRISRAFSAARSEQQTVDSRYAGSNGDALRQSFETTLGTDVPAETWKVLWAARFPMSAEQAVRRLVLAVQNTPVVASYGQLGVDGQHGIAIRRVPLPSPDKVDQGMLALQTLGHTSPEGLVLVDDVQQLSDVAKARHALEAMGGRLQSAGEPLAEEGQLLRQHPKLLGALIQLAGRQVAPNVSFNRDETDQAHQRALESVKQVKITIKKGEMVVRDGERLTPRHLMVLRGLGKTHQTSSVLMMGMGGVVLLLTLCALGGQRLGPSRRQMRHLWARDWFFLAFLFVACLTLGRFWLSLGRTVQESQGPLSRQVLLFCLPVALGPLVARLVLRAEVALTFCMLQALTLSLFADGSRMLTFYAVVGGVAAVGAIDSISRRGDLLWAGASAGVAQAAAALGIAMFEAQSAPAVYLWSVPAAFVGGALASILALSITPIIEWAFNYTTDLKLLELANLNHPALKELIVQAPGSYHHSIIVGALVEAAAESIGANPLLARVMAYYHDLGKGCNPGYFIENQRTGHNPHDKLKPSMSAMIIRRHVADGIDLAQRHGLGEQILDGIAQHHGNTLIHYFFHKAKEQAEEGQTVSEADYRYPGQKPQTREAALVMLGDSIEAASRALAEPSGPRLQGLVNRIISHKFTDGQLEECDLTLRDLHTIAKSFSVVLASIYHHRMEYPPTAADAARRNQTEKAGDSTPPHEKPTADNLRRLGL